MDRTKGADARRAIRALEGEERRKVVEYIRELEGEITTLKEAAYIDDLTGLYRRDAFHRFLVGSIEGALREGKDFAVVATDLDDFGQVNKRYGEDAGDTVLKEVSSLWRENVRKTDVLHRGDGETFEHGVGRQGGEEIYAVLQGISREDAGRKVEDIRSLTAEKRYRFTPLGGEDPDNVHVTSSSGIVMLSEVGEVSLLYNGSEGVLMRLRGEDAYEWVVEYARVRGDDPASVNRYLDHLDHFAPLFHQYSSAGGNVAELVGAAPLDFGAYMLMRWADSAMVGAKMAGKNRVVYANPLTDTPP